MIQTNIVKAASAADILGNTRTRFTRNLSATEPKNCIVCNVVLPLKRIDALRGLGTPTNRWMCIQCSEKAVTPKLGVFLGEVGTSELKIVDKLYTDSVRDMFVEGSTEEEEKG